MLRFAGQLPFASRYCACQKLFVCCRDLVWRATRPRCFGAMAIIYMATTLVWLLIALRFANPTQLVTRVKEPT